MATSKTSHAKPHKRAWHRINTWADRPSQAYLVEYGVLLFATAALLGLGIVMFGIVLDYLPNPPVIMQTSYTESVGLLAVVAVLLPLFWLLNKRTRILETQVPQVKNIGWRKAFLAVFLAASLLGAVGFAIAFMYELLVWLFARGLDGGTVPWRELLKYGLAADLLGTTAWLYSRDYRARSQDARTLRGSRLHRYGLVTLVLLVAIAFVLFPLRDQRHGYVDEVIVKDLRRVERSVRDFGRDNGRLPRELDELELDAQLRARAKAYGYEYERGRNGSTFELCATFRTNTVDDPDGSHAIGVLYKSARARAGNPTIHRSGRDCQTYELSPADIMPTYRRSGDFLFGEDPDFGDIEADF